MPASEFWSHVWPSGYWLEILAIILGGTDKLEVTGYQWVPLLFGSIFLFEGAGLSHRSVRLWKPAPVAAGCCVLTQGQELW